MKKLFGIALSLFFFANALAQGKPREEDTKAIYKAAYLYSFTKLVDWPPSYKSGDFEIGVLLGEEQENLLEELRKKYGKKQVGNQNISISEYESADEVKERCNILFIGKGADASLGRLRSKGRSTLLVSEGRGGLSKGAVINFVIRENQLEYELSRNNAERYGLTIGTQLRELAYKVQ